MNELFNDDQPEINQVRVMFSIGEQFPENGQETLVLIGKILPREVHNSPDIVEVLLEPENCYVWCEHGTVIDGFTDADFESYDRDCTVRKTPVGWVACCIEGEYQVLP